MELITWNLNHPSHLHLHLHPIDSSKDFGYRNYPYKFHYFTNCKSSSLALLTHARKKKNNPADPPTPVLKPTIIQQVSEDDDDDDVGTNDDEGIQDDDEFADEEFLDDGAYFEDELVSENAEVYAGDGAEGGGISLAGTWWDREALSIAESVAESFEGDLGMYAFRTLVNATIQVRVEKLSTKSGSPAMSDIEAFSKAYRARLDEAELAKTIPENVTLEVSSPGVERVIRIPQDLDRFKERPMYVKYTTEVAATGDVSENDGVFRLVSFDIETNSCTWGLADVRINREKAGKGRPMSKKQREWRLTTPFDSIRLIHGVFQLYNRFCNYIVFSSCLTEDSEHCRFCCQLMGGCPKFTLPQSQLLQVKWACRDKGSSTDTRRSRTFKRSTRLDSFLSRTAMG